VNDEKKISRLSTGNWITIGVFLVGIISAWAKIQVHISDENIHLTEEQRTALVRFTTITEEKLPNIETNHENIQILKTEFAVFKAVFGIELETNREEIEGLEDKVTRLHEHD
jgi:hypothetical protein